MAGGDAFDALLLRLTQELRCEHQREVDSLNAKITELTSKLVTQQDPPSSTESSDDRSPPAPVGIMPVMSRVLTDYSTTNRGPTGSNQFFLDFKAANQDRAADAAPPKPRAMRFIEGLVFSRGFEALVAVLIVLNAIVICLEAQYVGVKIGSGLGYDVDSWFQGWAAGQVLFTKAEWAFGTIYTLELLLRVLALRAQCFCDPWLWVDAAVVAFWVSGTLQYGFPMNCQVMRLCRLGKIVRLIRPFRRIKTFYALMLLSTSVSSSAVILMWTSVLLCVVLLINALVLHTLLVSYYFDNDAFPVAERRELYRYFGLVSTSIFSMFEVTLGNWPPLSRMLYEHVSDWFIVVTILHKLTVGFAFVGVVNGVFMQETFKVTKQNNELVLRQGLLASDVHSKKMKKLIREVCPSGDTRLSADDFQAMFRSDEIRTWLGIMEFAPQDTREMFRMMADDDGRLTVEGLIKGVERYKGPASKIDVQMLMHEHRRLRGMLNESGQGSAGRSPQETNDERTAVEI